MRFGPLFTLAALACTPDDDSGQLTDSADSSLVDSLVGDSDTSDDDSGHTGDTGDVVEPAWGDGPLTVSGQVYFFDMETLGVIDWIRDVEGAEVYVYEAPELRVTLSADDEHHFEIAGIPEDTEFTLAVVHPDFHPHLTATLTTADYDIDDITFQSVSHTIATLASALVGADISDETRCQMSTTVTAPDPENVWAPGEPGATVTTDPVVSAEQGPYYFDESVTPAPELTETTTDGGVLVVDAEPGTYLWDAHKDGVVFDQLKMKCVGGWLTNGSPPFGLNVIGGD